jgi:DNA-binding YbaB/EbfC family protein
VISLPGAGAFGNIGKLMQLPGKLKELQGKLAGMTAEGESGGGLVKVTATCAGQIAAVRIDPEVLASPDREMLEDLVTAAVNQALARARETAAEEARRTLGDLVPPGLAGSLGIPT